MKRVLAYQEVCDIIDFEDMCGVNNLLQELFSFEKHIILGKNLEVIGDFNEKGELGEYQVNVLREN